VHGGFGSRTVASVEATGSATGLMGLRTWGNVVPLRGWGYGCEKVLGAAAPEEEEE
jgi:hypothetical protein